MIPPTLEEVVSNILNQSFHSQGIGVTATSKNTLLKVILESAEAVVSYLKTLLVKNNAL